MSALCKELVEINGDLFLIKKVKHITEKTKNQGEIAAEWKKLNNLNKTFSKDNKFFFCELIEEANIIE